MEPRWELVVLNPAGAFPGRHWPIENYAEFCRVWARRSSRQVKFLLMGLRRMAPRAEELGRRIGPAAINLVGRDTAEEAFNFLRQAALVVSEDSGLMHLSWVAGAPTLGLFGASRGAWAAPHGNYCELVRACDQPDGTCMDGTCRATTATCLSRLAPKTVVDVASRLLDRIPDRRRVIYEPRRVR